jgi:putative ABC transport system ATP-binding protein
MTTQPIISVRKLSVTYFPGKSNEVRALKDVELEIFPGEFVIFFGPSGCGKSTLLYSLSGLEKNISGEILVKGVDLPTMKPRQREAFHQRTIGMIFQAYYLIPSLSVLENVTLPQVALGEVPHVRTSKATALLQKFGVSEQARKLPNELSGGQQQRVAICRSVMNDPDILFADEPVGNLDSKSTEEVMKLLRELNERDKKTVILVTHDPSHLHHAHRVFYMRDGQIVRVQQNTTEERKQSPVVAAAEAAQPSLKEWAKTVTPEILKRASEIVTGPERDEIERLLKTLTPEQRSRVEEYIRNLLTGIRRPTSDEDIERLARDIVRLLGGTDPSTIIRSRTWPGGSDVFLFEPSGPSRFPLLTLAVRVRLRPLLLRLKWMIIEAVRRFLSRYPALIRHTVYDIRAAFARACHAAARMLTAFLRRTCRLLPFSLHFLWRKATIAAGYALALVRRAGRTVAAVSRAAWTRFQLRTLCFIAQLRLHTLRAAGELLRAVNAALRFLVRTAGDLLHRIRLRTMCVVGQARLRAVCIAGRARVRALFIIEHVRSLLRLVDRTAARYANIARERTTARLRSLRLRASLLCTRVRGLTEQVRLRTAQWKQVASRPLARLLQLLLLIAGAARTRFSRAPHTPLPRPPTVSTTPGSTLADTPPLPSSALSCPPIIAPAVRGHEGERSPGADRPASRRDSLMQRLLDRLPPHLRERAENAGPPVRRFLRRIRARIREQLHRETDVIRNLHFP